MRLRATGAGAAAGWSAMLAVPLAACHGQSSVPVIDAVALGPDVVTTATVLEAEVMASDPDDDALTVHYAWTVDGAEAGEDGPELDGSLWFGRGQEVSVSVWAEAGGEASAITTSEGVVVENSGPMDVAVAIDPEAPRAALDTLTCTGTATDADDDALTWTYRWMLDGAEVGSDASLLPVTTGTYTCEGTVDDGEASATGLGSVTVAAAEIDAVDPWFDPGTWVEPPVFTAGEPVVVHYAGPLASGSAVVLRYGFDGWCHVGDVDQELVIDSEGQQTYYTDVAMTEPTAGHWEAVVDVPAGLTALHVEFTDGGSPESVDDNGGREWHAGTEFPYIAPYLSWNDEVSPRDGIVVSWENSTPSLGVVEYGTTEDLGTFAIGVDVDTRHHVALPDLPQGARVYYRVYDNVGHASETFSFTTLSDGEDAFTFLIASDMQDNASTSDRWPDVAEAMLGLEGDARFVLVPGDLASTDRPGHWWRYFEGGRALFTSIPMLPVPGNHDTKVEENPADFTSFAAWFALPGEERYYTLDYGPVRILGLDTESAEEQLPGGDQYLFAEAVLATADPGWVFAYQHYAPYTVNVIPPNGELDLQSITTLYDGHLDWVVTGHNHLNERYRPMRYEAELAPSGEYGRGPEDGVGYLVVPSAGDHPWEGILRETDDPLGLLGKVAYPAFDPDSGTADGQHGWLQVDVAGDALYFQTWEMGDADAPVPPYVADEVTQSR